MLLADDFHLEAGGTNFPPALLVFFLLCEVVSCHLSWDKTTGGTTTHWVGFELLLREHALGLTERRAHWVVKWARVTAAAGVVHVRAFEEAPGRVVFTTSALELLRPFLSPLHSFACAGARDEVRAIPPYGLSSKKGTASVQRRLGKRRPHRGSTHRRRTIDLESEAGFR